MYSSISIVSFRLIDNVDFDMSYIKLRVLITFYLFLQAMYQLIIKDKATGELFYINQARPLATTNSTFRI